MNSFWFAKQQKKGSSINDIIVMMCDGEEWNVLSHFWRQTDSVCTESTQTHGCCCSSFAHRSRLQSVKEGQPLPGCYWLIPNSVILVNEKENEKDQQFVHENEN